MTMPKLKFFHQFIDQRYHCMTHEINIRTRSRGKVLASVKIIFNLDVKSIVPLFLNWVPI